MCLLRVVRALSSPFPVDWSVDGGFYVVNALDASAVTQRMALRP
jgi:hypothetical protein